MLRRSSLAALALLALACQPTNPPPPKVAPKIEQKAPPQEAPKIATPTPPPPVITPPPPPPAVELPGPDIKVLEAGAEPREPLRLALKPGQTQTMVMTMKMGMAMEIGPQKAPPTSIPPMQMTMNLNVKEITPEGDIRTDFVLESIEVLPDPTAMPVVVDAMKTMLQSMSKISGSQVITPRGIGKSAQFNMPPDINPQIQQTIDGMQRQINQLAVPFPEEPVGVGARWTVTQHLEQQGMRLDQVATWELVKREGTTITLANSLIQSAAPQPMNAPGLPPGTSVMLEALESKGKGDVEADLTQLSPLKSKVGLEMHMRMLTTAVGINTPTKMDLTLDVEIAGK